jgi:hypothetical protein
MTPIQTLNSSTSTPLPRKWVDALLDKMRFAYGKKFTDQWGALEPEKMSEYWQSELAGYTGPEISRGVKEMESKDWPPTLPEFKRMCRAQLDPMTAYYEAVMGTQARAAGEMGAWSHPAVYWAAMPLSFDLGSQTYSQIRGRWEGALSDQMAKGEWEAIPRPMVALPAPGKGQLSKEAAAKMLRELEAGGITKNAKDTTDHKRWAKRILERVARGDKTLLLIQIQFAREAMAVTE